MICVCTCILHNFFQAPLSGEEQSRSCLCCIAGPVSLEATLQRSAYCCGENMKVTCQVQNGSEQNVWLIIRLTQVKEPIFKQYMFNHLKYSFTSANIQSNI